MRSLNEVMQDYNRLLARYKKADTFFSNPKISEEEKSKEIIVKAYEELIIDINKLMNEYQQLTGKDMTNEIALSGFDIKKN